MSVKIIQGEDRVLTVRLKNSDGSSYDLTGKTEITACFIGTSGTITKLLTATQIAVVGSDDCGTITVSLTDADTALLSEGTQGFTVSVDKGTEKRKINLANSLKVEAAIC
jgi:hypothetical protein